MITVDAPVSFLLGGAIALLTQMDAQPNDPKRNKVLMQGIMLQSMVVSPLILFFLLRFPDWEWHYLFNAREFFFSEDTLFFGVLCIIALMALLNGAFYLGFVLVERYLLKDQLLSALKLLGAVALGSVTIIVILIEQTLYLGTYEEFQSQQAPLIFESWEFVSVMVAAGPLLFIPMYKIIKGDSA